MERAVFNKSEYNKYDKLGRDYAKAIALKYGFRLEDNPDQYGIDLLVYSLKSNQLIGYADVEVRPDLWDGDKTRFRTIHAIKKKVENYSKLPLPAWYFSISGDGRHLLSCKFEDMLKEKLVEVSNKRERVGESFYDVPVSKWKHLTLKD